MWLLYYGFGLVLMVLVLFAVAGLLLLHAALDADTRAREAGLEPESERGRVGR